MLTPILASIFLVCLILVPKSGPPTAADPEHPICNFTYAQSNPPPYTRTQLNLLNDEALIWPLPLSCKPESFGYSLKEAQALFEDKSFPKCQKSSYSQSLSISLPTNTLSMNCSGKYLLGPNSEVFGRTEFFEDLTPYKSPVHLDAQEYAIGSCDTKSEGFFDQVIYKNRVNRTVLERAKKTLKNEPINIAMVVLDSVSRRSFYRKLPKTVKFLNELQRPVHDFLIHNVNGEYSADSFMPSFMGDVFYSRLNNEELEGNPFDEYMIFKYMHERGFVSFVATDDCGNDLAAFIGKKAEVDHKMASFWCMAEKYYNFENNAKRQRCIGPKDAHTYMLNYILDFSKNYESVSRFSYIHLNTAHEGSGTVISTLDNDLVEFISSLTKRPEKTVLFLMGDHGMRYGSWFTKIDGSHEHRLPLLLIFQSESMSASIPQSDSFLSHNTKRLVTKLDLHLTLKSLIKGTKFESSLICETSSRYRSYNLFSEIVPDSRNCIESGIPLFWCSCLPFIDSDELASSFEVKKIVEDILYQVNSMSKRPASTVHSVCVTLTLKQILSVKIQKVPNEEYFNIKFKVNESQKALFEALVLVSDVKLRRREKDGFGSYPFLKIDKKYIKVMYVKRLDAYAGVCQELCVFKGIDPVFCICQEFDILKVTEKSLLKQVYSDREVIVTDDQCEVACKKLKMDCDEFASVLYTCGTLSKQICGNCELSDKKYSYVEKNKCFVQPNSTFDCETKNKNSLCYCKKVSI